jgi:hypothetical protein
MVKGSKSPTNLTKHHKVPRSRCVDSLAQPDNISKLERQYHEAWHTIFTNRTPFEIAVMLIEKMFPHGFVRAASIQVSWQGRSEDYTYVYREDKPPLEPWALRSAAQKKAWMKLFEYRGFYSVLNEVLTASRWAPQGYFTAVRIVVKDEGTIELGFGQQQEG